MTSTEAFVPGPRTRVPGAPAGPLAGLLQAPAQAGGLARLGEVLSVAIRNE